MTENDHELLRELYGIWDTLNQNRMLEAWHDAQQIREEALDLFSHGIVDLQTRAKIERLYWSIMREVNQIAGGLKHAPDEFRGLPKLLADKYFCNFSLFQSLPDSWAIDQIFPIMLSSVWTNGRTGRLPCRTLPAIRTVRLPTLSLPRTCPITCRYTP